MRLDRRRLRNVIFEEYRSLNEASAKNWDEYISVGKDTESKNTRKTIKRYWDIVGGNEEMYPPGDVKSPASPAKFSSDYSGWVKWYKTCIKDNYAMRLVGKKPGPNVHIHPKEMLKVYLGMVPSGKLVQAKKEDDTKKVDDFMAGLNFGEPTSSAELANLGKTDAEKALEIISNLPPYKSGQENLGKPDLEGVTSGDDAQEPELKFKKQSEEEKEKTRGKVNESRYLNRASLRQLIRQTLRGK